MHIVKITIRISIMMILSHCARGPHPEKEDTISHCDTHQGTTGTTFLSFMTICFHMNTPYLVVCVQRKFNTVWDIEVVMTLLATCLQLQTLKSYLFQCIKLDLY